MIEPILLFWYFIGGAVWGWFFSNTRAERKWSRQFKEAETIKINPNFKFPKA